MIDGKTINDPIFGFIKIPHGILLDIVEHPLMQRLTRVKQLGLTSMVYPAAQHTRFQHSLGAFHLMSEVIASLTQKGVFVFDSEAEAVEAAILMHDIGHGPFSHVLENTLISGISHEEISLMMMEQINREMKGELNLALKIFKNDYAKKFLHQLISSQLDMDRLDYLRRDSFFTGVAEGNIGCTRIINMLNVKEDNLVVSYKGLYSIESYLMARRLMYWQVYLHKTTVAGEKVLINALLRARYLVRNGYKLFATPCLSYFLSNDITAEHFRTDEDAQRYYAMLDDNDIWCSLKEWMNSGDKILATLSDDIINRRLFKIEMSDTQPDSDYVKALRKDIAVNCGISLDETDYMLSIGKIQQDMYDLNDEQINILMKDGKVKDISESSGLLDRTMLSKKICKYYLCYQRF